MAVACNQSRFRFRSDTLTVDSGSVVWAAAENTNWVPTPVQQGTPFRLRIEVGNTGSTSTGAQAWNIFVQRNGAGGYAQVTSSGTYVQSSSAASSDADNTSLTVSRLTSDFNTGTPAFVNGQYDNTGSTGNITLGIGSTNNQRTELEFGLVLTSSCLAGDFFDFRVYRGTSTALNTYTVTPRVTVTQAAFTATSIASGAAGFANSQPTLATIYTFTSTNLATGAAGFANSKPSITQLLYANSIASSSSYLDIANFPNPPIATSLATSSPRLASQPSLTLATSLTATSIASGSASLGTPNVICGVATSLASGADNLGLPPLATTYTFTATSLAVGAAGLGNPAIAQVNGLSAASLATRAASLGTPNAICGVATSLAASAAELGLPPLATTYTFTGTSLAVGSAGLGQPVAHVSNILAANSLASFTAFLGSPNVVNTVAVSIASLAASLDTPLLVTKYTFTSTGIAAGAADLGNPIFESTDLLTGLSIASGNAALGQPAFNQTAVLSSVAIASSSAFLGEPGVGGQVDTFIANDLASGASGLGQPIFEQIVSLSAVSLATGSIAFTFPAWTQIVHLPPPVVGATIIVGKIIPLYIITNSEIEIDVDWSVAYVDIPLPTGLSTTISGELLVL